MSRIFGVHHINLECKDLEATKQWYRDIFNLEDVDRGPGIGVVQNQLHVGESELHFTVRDDAVYMAEGHPAFEIKDWNEMIAHLVQNGIGFERGGPTYRPDGSTAAFIRDLEGNLLEIVHHPTGRRWARDN